MSGQVTLCIKRMYAPPAAPRGHPRGAGKHKCKCGQPATIHMVDLDKWTCKACNVKPTITQEQLPQ